MTKPVAWNCSNDGKNWVVTRELDVAQQYAKVVPLHHLPTEEQYLKDNLIFDEFGWTITPNDTTDITPAPLDDALSQTSGY
jgi:hypothetical protein